MNRYVSALFFLAICAFPCQANDSANSAAAENEVLEVQTTRFRAMTENNVKALESILADELSYTHSMGRSETKAEFLASLQSGNVRYDSIVPNDVQVRIYESTAIVTGISAMKVSAGGNQFALSLRFIEVYKNTDCNWQLVAWQSTRLPDD